MKDCKPQLFKKNSCDCEIRFVFFDTCQELVQLKAWGGMAAHDHLFYLDENRSSQAIYFCLTDFLHTHSALGAGLLCLIRIWRGHFRPNYEVAFFLPILRYP